MALPDDPSSLQKYLQTFRDRKGWSYPHISAWNGNQADFELFGFFNLSFVDLRNSQNSTPLHLASIKGHISVIQSLVERGANISAQNDFGWTPLHYAAWYERIDIVEFLVKKDPNAVDIQNNEDFTALHLATFKCNLPIVRQLLTGSSQLNLTTLSGWTPLNIAASTCQVTIS